MASFWAILPAELILTLGAVTFGVVLGFPSPALIDFDQSWSIGKFEKNIFNSISPLTAILGPFASELLLKWFSRRQAAFIISVAGVFFWLLMLATKESTFWVGILSRALTGIVMGAYSSITPMYIIEIAPKSKSGFFGSLNNLGIALGLVLIYLCGNWLHWRALTFVGAGVCLLEALLVWFVPESPASKKTKEDRKETLWQKMYLKSLLIGVSLMFFQQFSGINAILTNLDKLLIQAGIKTNSGIASAFASSAQVISIFVSGLIVDKLGRRTTWMISASGIIISHVIYALSTKLNWSPIVSILGIFLFLLFFGLGTGPIAWYVVPELFPATVRSTATSVVSSSNWLFSFLIIFIFDYLNEGIGNFATMLIFAFISLLSVVFGSLFIVSPPEALLSDPLLGAAE